LDGSAEGVEYWLESELTPLGAGADEDRLDGAGVGEDEEASEENVVTGVEACGGVDGDGGGGGAFFGRTPSPGAVGNGAVFGSVVAAVPPAPVSVAWPLRD